MEWKNLPNEMKEMVVQRSTQATRNSLKCCSRSSKQLVETARLNAIYYLEIHLPYRTPQKWRITMQARRESQMECEEFESFEKFSSSLLKTVKSAGCIRTLIIHSLPDESRTPFKLRSSERQPTVLVERALFYGGGTVEQKNVLSQMEPGFLRHVLLTCDGGNSEIYDMPQIILAETVIVERRSSIEERQLLNLNASNVWFDYINCSVRKFIDKCAGEAETKPRRFYFERISLQNMGLDKFVPEIPSRTFLLETACPYLKMELQIGRAVESKVFVAGCIRNDSQRYSTNLWQFDFPSSFRVIEKLHIDRFSSGAAYITISRPNYSEFRFVCKKYGEFQQKVDEIMESVDFIKFFRIRLANSKEKMMWKPRRENNLLMVKYLDVGGQNSITSIQDLLEQIDPNFAMSSVKISGHSELEHSAMLYDMPQIRNAGKVQIRNPYLRDEQLLGMKAKIISCHCSFEGVEVANTSLTKAGINQYIKQHLRNLDNENMSFALGRLPPDGTSEEIFEGLEIMESTVDNVETKWTIKTTNPKFVLVVRITLRGAISGELVRRSGI